MTRQTPATMPEPRAERLDRREADWSPTARRTPLALMSMLPIPLNLPDGCTVRGRLYSREFRYELGDVLEVELPTGLVVDLGWDENGPHPFRIVVYRDWFGNHFWDQRAATPKDAALAVEQAARAFGDLITINAQIRRSGQECNERR